MRDGQTRLNVFFRLRVTAHKIAGLARSPERPAPSEVAHLGPRPRQCILGHPMSQRDKAAMQQVHSYGENQSQSQLGAILGVIAPRMSRQNVLAFAVKPRDPRAL